MFCRAVQLSPAAQARLAILPFEPAGELNDCDTCHIPFPRNSSPMLITKGVVLPSPKQKKGKDVKEPEHFIFVDVRFWSALEGRSLHDFDIVGSWADMKLPDMPSPLTWEVWVDCECRYIEEDFHGDRGPRTPDAATLWNHRLVTHDKPLREIAECARGVFKAHEQCVPRHFTHMSLKCSAETKVDKEGSVVCSGKEEPDTILSAGIFGKVLRAYMK